MSRDIETALADCLERLEGGEATVEEALGGYPELRAELEPLLRLSVELRSMPRVVAPESLRTSRRPVFRSPSRVTPIAAASRGRGWGAIRPASAWAAPLVRLAAGLAAALLLLGGSMVASANSLPEEPLYPLKLAMESAQLALVPDPRSRVELEIQFAARRLEEVQSAARQGKTEAVQRGLALYEERVESALSAAQAAPIPVERKEDPRLQDALERQQQLLEEVYSQVPDPAKDAILHAQEVSKRGRTRAEEVRADPDGKTKKEPKAEPSAEAPTAATPTPALPAPTGTPVAADGHEPPGKGKARSAATAVPGQGEPAGGKGQSKEEKGQGSRPSASGDEETNSLEAIAEDSSSASGSRTPESSVLGARQSFPSLLEFLRAAMQALAPERKPSTPAPTATPEPARRQGERGHESARGGRPANDPRPDSGQLDGDNREKNGKDNGPSPKRSP